MLSDSLHPGPPDPQAAQLSADDPLWEQRFRALTDKSADAILLRNRQGVIIYASASTANVFGYEPREIVGQATLNLVHPTDAAETKSLIASILDQPGNSVQATVRVRHKNGSWRWMEGTATNLLADATVGAIVINLRDITERKQAEDTLRESQRLYQTLFQQAPMGVIHTTLDGAFMRVNRRFCALVGYSEPELLNSRFQALTLQEEVASDTAFLRKLLAGEIEVFQREKRYQHKNGHLVWANVTVVLQRNNAGEPEHFIVSTEDISERKRIEEKLRESEAHYRSLISTSPDGIALTDPAGRVTYASPRMFTLFGIPPETPVLGRSVLEWVVPEEREQAGRAMRELLVNKQPGQPDEFRVLKGDSSIFWVEICSTPLLDAQGEVTGMMSILRDVTTRKQTEARLAQQAALLDNANDAMLVRDLEHRILYWNKAAERLYGWSAAEALGQRLIERIFCDLERFETAHRAVLERGDWSGEIRQLTRDRKEFVVLSRWTLLRDERSRPQAIFVIDTDITERKQLEAQSLRAQRLESIGQLAGGIAHDLNNILAPILMVGSMLREHVTAPETRPWLDALDSSARRGAEIVKQILAFSRGLKTEMLSLQTGHLLKDFVPIIRETFPKSIVLKTSFPRDLWLVRGDPTQLHQVLMNLCVNARDAMPDGGVLTLAAENLVVDELFAGKIPGAKPGPHVVWLVADTGMGIAPEHLDRIFDPFFTTKDVGQGTGLGLSTTLGIVRAHEGFLRVESTPGRGTQFRVYLPARETVLEPLNAPAEPIPRGNGEWVLVVDDEENIREVTRRVLERYGYQVLTAREGTEAIVLAAQRRTQIQVVLTDLMMPQMDGLALLRALQHVDFSPKIIAATGLDAEHQAHALARLGVHTLLRKPYRPEILLRAVHEVLHPTAPLK